MYWICDLQAQRRAGVEIQADGKADVLVLENKAASDQSKSPKVPKKNVSLLSIFLCVAYKKSNCSTGYIQNALNKNLNVIATTSKT